MIGIPIVSFATHPLFTGEAKNTLSLLANGEILPENEPDPNDCRYKLWHDFGLLELLKLRTLSPVLFSDPVSPVQSQLLYSGNVCIDSL